MVGLARAKHMALTGQVIDALQAEQEGLLSHTAAESEIPVVARKLARPGGQQNLARFRNAKFDALFERQGSMPDGPQRDAVIREAAEIMIAYMPYKLRVHRIGTDLWQPWLTGYKRHPFSTSFWRYVDIDGSKAPGK